MNATRNLMVVQQENLSGVQVLGESDAQEVNLLRENFLINPGGFVAEKSAVQFNESDTKGKLLGVRNWRGQLIATMRVEIISDPEELTSKLDFEFLNDKIEFPVGLLGKAVTDRAYEGLGLNTYLRYLAFRYFHGKKIRYVVGTVVPSAARIPLMKRLGYEFISNKQGWRRFGYDSFGETWVTILDLEKHYSKAMKILERRVQSLQHEFPFYGW